MRDNNAAPLRILLLEDNCFLRSALSRLLSSHGWEVLSYPEPNECPLHVSSLCTCKQTEVCADALVSDLEMPHMNGLDFARELLQKGCKIPNLAMLTGSDDTELLVEARAFGFAVFNKADGIAALLSWLRNIETHLVSERKLIQWADA